MLDENLLPETQGGKPGKSVGQHSGTVQGVRVIA